MKVSGFTIVRNGQKYDYPFTESIRSMLSLCDEVIVAVGNSDDDTLAMVRAINSPKIRIIETVWDDSLREGGRVLAVETDKAKSAIAGDADWCIYLQADEVFHEKDYPEVRRAMRDNLNDKRVDGLLFDHLNFYGSFDYIADSRRWSYKQIRVIRNDPQINSYRDAMSFKKNGRNLLVKKINATVYHYGWVRTPDAMQKKLETFQKLWHDDEWIEKNVQKADEFDYSQIDSLAHFTGTHPQVMLERINRMNWKFDFDPTKGIKLSLRLRILNWLEKKYGIEIGKFKTYRIIS
ncbi:MAG: glycosyltransferase family 2 protein [Sphingobacteriia bacterium]|nr:glycosyltransferase family 2 protein [Sphingobacteriia bacterium]